MKEYQSHMTERIVNLTLEIICLLTGESFPPVTCGDHVTFTVPSSRSLTPERSTNKKILEVIHKMIEQLTGEIPVRFQDVSVYFSMEEWQYLEEHKDLYKDVIMEDEPPLTSPDGSRDKNPPERCTGSPYFQEFKQENHNFPHHYQDEILINVKVEDIPKEQKSYSADDWPHNREINAPEIGTGSAGGEEPLNGLVNLIPKYHIEDCAITDDSPDEKPNIHFGLSYMTPTESNPEGLCHLVLDRQNEALQGHNIVSHSKCGQEFSQNSTFKLHFKGNTDKFPKENPFSPEIHPGVSCMSPAKLDPEGSYHSDMDKHNGALQSGKNISRSQYGQVFSQNSAQKLHCTNDPEEEMFSHPESRRCFKSEAQFITYSGTPTTEMIFSCPECGECFTLASELVSHQRSHSSGKPYSCLECGKHFMGKQGLHRHYKSHSGEKPHQCSECGKGFMWRCDLIQHRRLHTGEKPFSCLECGKSFTRRAVLLKHQRVHTARKAISCLVCGECFTWKSDLDKHQRKAHTGERTLSCIDCGKRYTSRSHLLDHQRTHTGEKPFSCPECKRCFTSVAQLNKHRRTHTCEQQFP